MFGALADEGINIEMITSSEIRITCIIAEDDVEKAARALHGAFRLEVTQHEVAQQAERSATATG
jgi:aspartate kinase